MSFGTEVVHEDGKIIRRFGPTGLLDLSNRTTGPSDGRVDRPTGSTKRFPICTEMCYCPRVPAKARRVDTDA